MSLSQAKADVQDGSMQLTWFGANSWLLEWQQRILIDPWLVGSLVFGGQTWLFQGERGRPLEVLPANIDLILLSQGLADHAHRPTLEKLDRTIPVVGSVSAAEVAQRLGYRTVTALAHGQTYRLAEQIEIQAVPGAPIGLQQENGYLLRDLNSDLRLYYEPHGFHDPSLSNQGPVEVVIAPVVDLALPVAGSIIRGRASALSLAQQLRPQVWLPTAAGGEITYHGLLNRLLQTVGTVDQFRTQLAQHHLATAVIEPPPGQPIDIVLAAPAV